MPDKHQQYKDPAGGTQSSIGTEQFNTFFYSRKALAEIVKEQYFQPLADVMNMPKHYGKKIKKYHYMPLLDDRNVNDQGIDATGAEDLTAGNLYGSSKDIGTIPNKLPTLTENGGRVNRVGYTRVQLEGSLEKLGFFDEYTQESLDFDTDSELEMHVHRESLRGANEIVEDMLQIDLLSAAGVVRYAGSATSTATVGMTDIVTYDDLLRLQIQLDDNRCPKATKVIKGSRMTDTRTISAARILYCGSELQPTIEAMVDLHNNPAFVPVHQYADAGNILNGEIGTVGRFRVVIVPEMLNWTDAGATDNNGDVHGTGTAVSVFPMLVVGSGSFTTIGFQTDGKTVKFKIKHSKPGSPESYANDPFGEKGFNSIKWYYGSMILRPEWIGLIKTAATL